LWENDFYYYSNIYYHDENIHHHDSNIHYYHHIRPEGIKDWCGHRYEASQRVAGQEMV
jgi:hypothetical protein